MKVSDEILEKLTKILRLANDRAAQPGEVEAAMGKARELAMRHSIDLASVNLNPDTKVEGGIQVEKNSTLKTRSKYKQPYHYWVFSVLQEVFEVKVIISEWNDYGGKVITAIHIIGEPVDVAIACAVYPFLEKVFPATLSRAVSAGRLTYCAAHTNGCYRGIHWGIVEANKREVEKLKKEEQQTLAMVVRKKGEVVTAAMYEMFPAMKAREDLEAKKKEEGKEKKARKVQMSWEAVNYGHQEGKKINLNQVGDKSK